METQLHKGGRMWVHRTEIEGRFNLVPILRVHGNPEVGESLC